MSDNVSKAKSKVRVAQEARTERAAEFWQDTIRQGRRQEQIEGMPQRQESSEKKHQPRQ